MSAMAFCGVPGMMSPGRAASALMASVPGLKWPCAWVSLCKSALMIHKEGGTSTATPYMHTPRKHYKL